MALSGYHWIWWLLGFLFVPRISFMILLIIYAVLPQWLIILGFIIAVITDLNLNKK